MFFQIKNMVSVVAVVLLPIGQFLCCCKRFGSTRYGTSLCADHSAKICTFTLVLGVVVLQGCTPQYGASIWRQTGEALSLSDSQTLSRRVDWRLHPETSVYLARPEYPLTAISGNNTYPRTRYALFQSLEGAFRGHFPATQVAPTDMSLAESLVVAERAGARILAWPKLIAVAGPDRQVTVQGAGDLAVSNADASHTYTLVQIVLFDVSDGKQLDIATIKVQGGMFGTSKKSPAQAFDAAASVYVKTLSAVL